MAREIVREFRWVILLSVLLLAGFVLSKVGRRGPISSREFHHRGGVWSLCAVPERELLVSGGYDGRILFWNTRNKSMTAEVTAHSGFVGRVLHLPGSRVVASSGNDSALKIWDLDRHHLLQTLKDDDDLWTGLQLATARKGQVLLGGNWRGETRIWKTETWDEVLTIRPKARAPDGESHMVRALAVAQVKNLVAIGHGTGDIQIWDLTKQRRMAEMNGPSGVTALELTSDEEYLLSGHNDGTVNVWSLTDMRSIAQLQCHCIGSFEILLTTDNKYFITAETHGEIVLWEFQTWQKLWSHRCNDRIGPIVWANPNRELYVGTESGAILRVGPIMGGE